MSSTREMARKTNRWLKTTQGAVIAGIFLVTAVQKGADWLDWVVAGPQNQEQVGAELRAVKEQVDHIHDVLEREPWEKVDSLTERFIAYDSAARLQRAEKAEAETQRALQEQWLRLIVCQAHDIPINQCEP